MWSLRLGDPAAQQLNAVAVSGATTATIVGSFAGAPDFGGTVLTSAGTSDAFAATLQTP